MKSVDEIKSDIKSLPHREYMKLAHWFSEHDWKAWDEEIERDAASGRLDFLKEEAMKEKKAGRLREL